MTELFNESRGAAGSRTLRDQMNLAGFSIGRFKVRSLMREAGLRSGQPGPSPYKKHGQARVDIPNLLDRQFDVPAPNRVYGRLYSNGNYGRRDWCEVALNR